MSCIIFFIAFVFIARSKKIDDIFVETIPNWNEIQTFVNVHNFYRASVNPPATLMQAISWRDSLATTSNTWAMKCIWAHSGTPGVGENLYASSIRTPVSDDFNPSTSVNSWGYEKIYYRYATNTCDLGKVCGHYTQVVWNTSLYVGCAFQDCASIVGLPWVNGGTLVVCQYSPPGNYVGKRPY